MADHCLAFYNAAILAYGQTGSGELLGCTDFMATAFIAVNGICVTGLPSGNLHWLAYHRTQLVHRTTGQDFCWSGAR